MQNSTYAENKLGSDSFELTQRLLRERIVFLGSVDDDSAPTRSAPSCCCLAAEDPDRDISLYINSPGGSVTDGLAIYDTMQYVPCDVRDVCIGHGGVHGAVPAVRRGARASGSRCRTAGSSCTSPPGRQQGQAADIAIQAEQIVYLKQHDGRADRLSHRPDRSSAIEADSDRDRWFTAEEAKEYGFIDQVIERHTARPSAH